MPPPISITSDTRCTFLTAAKQCFASFNGYHIPECKSRSTGKSLKSPLHGPIRSLTHTGRRLRLAAPRARPARVQAPESVIDGASARTERSGHQNVPLRATSRDRRLPQAATTHPTQRQPRPTDPSARPCGVVDAEMVKVIAGSDPPPRDRGKLRLLRLGIRPPFWAAFIGLVSRRPVLR